MVLYVSTIQKTNKACLCNILCPLLMLIFDVDNAIIVVGDTIDDVFQLY